MFQGVRRFLYDLKRKRFGTYALEDLRPRAIESPYTFFVPTDAEIAALRPGVFVKLIFESVPPSLAHNAERMWVEITQLTKEGLEGRLDNVPLDIPQLTMGQIVPFQAHHVASILWESEEDKVRFGDSSEEDRWFNRCFVDECILNDGVPVGFLYREEPEDFLDENWSDTGWRIRGVQTGLSNTEIDARSMRFVAIGAVLNRDDSFLHLLGEQVGTAFERSGPDTPFSVAKDITDPDA